MTHDVPADAVVRLWHPVRATVAEIEAWRTFLTDTASTAFRLADDRRFTDAGILAQIRQR